LIGKIEGDLLDQVLPPGSGLVKAFHGGRQSSRFDAAVRLPARFLGQRVLGQYDLAIISAALDARTPAFPGREHQTDRGEPKRAPQSFRTWIALHETTHAFEFEAHPWLRPYLAERLERQLTSLSSGASLLSRDAITRGWGRSLRGKSPGEHWMEG